MAVIAIAQLIVVLDDTIANIALPTLQNDLGICPQHHRASNTGNPQQAGTGLFSRHTPHIVECRLPLPLLFRDIQIKRAERQAQAGQQFRAAGRAGGKMQHA